MTTNYHEINPHYAPDLGWPGWMFAEEIETSYARLKARRGERIQEQVEALMARHQQWVDEREKQKADEKYEAELMPLSAGSPVKIPQFLLPGVCTPRRG